MDIKEIKWLDEGEKEAILEVTQDMKSLICFSCPCLYGLGYTLSEPLECVDASDIVLCDTVECDIKKLEGTFKYKLIGRVKDKENGLIDVNGFDLHIDEKIIPKDIINGMYIEFVTSRIDVW